MTDPVSGCSSNSSVTLSPPTLINITAVSVTNIPCYNGSNGAISIQTDNGPANIQYDWSPSVGNSGNVNNLTSGTYSVTVTNPDGCSDDTTVTIIDGEPIFVAVTDSIGSECGESNGSLTINATGGAGGFSYFWPIGQSGPTLNNVDAGAYDVIITDAAGCVLTLPFSLGCNSLDPIVPNQFISPNNDGKNDVWTILNLELYPENSVTIYNRWGNVVYEASPYKNDWNGTFKGNAAEPLPAATYFYVIDTDKKSQEPYTGYIEIQP
jgi:gliding motility-associated-like protein